MAHRLSRSDLICGVKFVAWSAMAFVWNGSKWFQMSLFVYKLWFGMCKPTSNYPKTNKAVSQDTPHSCSPTHSLTKGRCEMLAHQKCAIIHCTLPESLATATSEAESVWCTLHRHTSTAHYTGTLHPYTTPAHFTAHYTGTLHWHTTPAHYTGTIHQNTTQAPFTQKYTHTLQ